MARNGQPLRIAPSKKGWYCEVASPEKGAGRSLLFTLLKAAGLTHKEMGDRVGRTSPAVTSWVGGSRDMTVHRLAAACDAAGYELHLVAVPATSGAQDKSSSA